MFIGAATEPRVTLGPQPSSTKSTSGRVPTSNPAAPLGPEHAGPEHTSVFARILAGVGVEVQQGESVVRDAIAAARSGRGFAPAELIALQAGVYRYSEAVDLAAKLVDRATSGLKTVVQGQ
jgi:hypothetical protein